MKTEELLKLTIDEQGKENLEVSEDHDAIVIALTMAIKKDILEGNQDLFNILFSVTVHLLRMDISGEALEDYIDNLRTFVSRSAKLAKESKEELNERLYKITTQN